jgi:hypothetical protein
VPASQDIIATRAATDPADKAKVYAEMGIDIAYHQDRRVVVESRPRVAESSVGEASGLADYTGRPTGGDVLDTVSVTTTAC